VGEVARAELDALDDRFVEGPNDLIAGMVCRDALRDQLAPLVV
jgi:hypothetical protein